MASSRTHRSHWYVEGVVFSIVLILLAFALFITSGGSSTSSMNDTLTAGQPAYPQPKTDAKQSLTAAQPTITPLGGNLASTSNQNLQLTPYPAPRQTNPPTHQQAPTGGEPPSSDTANAIQSIIHVSRYPDLPSASREASVILIGSIKQILPARWTTPSGQRPANPQTARQVIFRPVIVEVEEYLKGESQQKLLHIYAWGGRIGQDVFEQRPDDLYVFQEGEKVVLFLKQPDQQPSPFALNGSNLWSISEHYTLTSDNQAKNFYHSLSLDELRANVRIALQP